MHDSLQAWDGKTSSKKVLVSSPIYSYIFHKPLPIKFSYKFLLIEKIIHHVFTDLLIINMGSFIKMYQNHIAHFMQDRHITRKFCFLSQERHKRALKEQLFLLVYRNGASVPFKMATRGYFMSFISLHEPL